MNIPWWFKMIAKSTVGMLPVSYERLRSGLTGRRGGMEHLEYAVRIFESYMQDFESRSGSLRPGATLLELGPGGSLLSGAIAKRSGFDHAILIDVGDFASRDVDTYADILGTLEDSDREAFESARARSGNLLDGFSAIGVSYLTDGLASLQTLPDECVDFSFSNAVLEHVARSTFDATAAELHRVQRPGGLSVHQVDYKDHLGGGLNNLRFRSQLWESRFFPNQGYYTNRLRHRDVLECFERCGFDVEDDRARTWDSVPLDRRSLAPEYRHYSDDDLRVRGARITLRRPERVHASESAG